MPNATTQEIFPSIERGDLEAIRESLDAEKRGNSASNLGSFDSERPMVRAGKRVEVSVDFSYDPDPAAVRRYVDLRLGVGRKSAAYT